ncbi:molybdenum cofactor guanylyltransferase [bacterium]|nr:molybdenum cofactor guanylyltransferase [candidate division CSSED10-310 bacterium]
MSDSRFPYSAIILAGGSSRRMGINKLLLPWGEGNLLINAINVFRHDISDVCVVGNATSADIPGVRWLTDDERSGPLYGLYTGLKAALHHHAFVTAADLPFLDLHGVYFLHRSASGADVTVVRTDDGVHPLFGFYTKSCLPSIQSYLEQGGRKVTGFWDQITTHIIDVGADQKWKKRLFNINKPADYERAIKLARSQNESLPDETESMEAGI